MAKKFKTLPEYDEWLYLVMKKRYKQWGYNSPEEALIDAMNDNTYDYKAFYDKEPGNALDILNDIPDKHFSDIGKRIYHPTASNLSIYSGKKSDSNPDGIVFGEWINDLNYKPSIELLESPYFDINRTREYLNKAELNPVDIILPLGTIHPNERFDYDKHLITPSGTLYALGGNLFAGGGDTSNEALRKFFEAIEKMNEDKAIAEDMGADEDLLNKYLELIDNAQRLFNLATAYNNVDGLPENNIFTREELNNLVGNVTVKHITPLGDVWYTDKYNNPLTIDERTGNTIIHKSVGGRDTSVYANNGLGLLLDEVVVTGKNKSGKKLLPIQELSILDAINDIYSLANNHALDPDSILSYISSTGFGQTLGDIMGNDTSEDGKPNRGYYTGWTRDLDDKFYNSKNYRDVHRLYFEGSKDAVKILSTLLASIGAGAKVAELGYSVPELWTLFKANPWMLTKIAATDIGKLWLTNFLANETSLKITGRDIPAWIKHYTGMNRDTAEWVDPTIWYGPKMYNKVAGAAAKGVEKLMPGAMDYAGQVTKKGARIAAGKLSNYINDTENLVESEGARAIQSAIDKYNTYMRKGTSVADLYIFDPLKRLYDRAWGLGTESAMKVLEGTPEVLASEAAKVADNLLLEPKTPVEAYLEVGVISEHTNKAGEVVTKYENGVTRKYNPKTKENTWYNSHGKKTNENHVNKEYNKWKEQLKLYPIVEEALKLAENPPKAKEALAKVTNEPSSVNEPKPSNEVKSETSTEINNSANLSVDKYGRTNAQIADELIDRTQFGEEKKVIYEDGSSIYEYPNGQRIYFDNKGILHSTQNEWLEAMGENPVVEKPGSTPLNVSNELLSTRGNSQVPEGKLQGMPDIFGREGNHTIENVLDYYGGKLYTYEDGALVFLDAEGKATLYGPNGRAVGLILDSNLALQSSQPLGLPLARYSEPKQQLYSRPYTGSQELEVGMPTEYPVRPKEPSKPFNVTLTGRPTYNSKTKTVTYNNGDGTSITVLPNGRVMYRKNGKLCSKENYDAARKAAAEAVSSKATPSNNSVNTNTGGFNTEPTFENKVLRSVNFSNGNRQYYYQVGKNQLTETVESNGNRSYKKNNNPITLKEFEELINSEETNTSTTSGSTNSNTNTGSNSSSNNQPSNPTPGTLPEPLAGGTSLGLSSNTVNFEPTNKNNVVGTNNLPDGGKEHLYITKKGNKITEQIHPDGSRTYQDTNGKAMTLGEFEKAVNYRKVTKTEETSAGKVKYYNDGTKSVTKHYKTKYYDSEGNSISRKVWKDLDPEKGNSAWKRKTAIGLGTTVGLFGTGSLISYMSNKNNQLNLMVANMNKAIDLRREQSLGLSTKLNNNLNNNLTTKTNLNLNNKLTNNKLQVNLGTSLGTKLGVTTKLNTNKTPNNNNLKYIGKIIDFIIDNNFVSTINPPVLPPYQENTPTNNDRNNDQGIYNIPGGQEAEDIRDVGIGSLIDDDIKRRVKLNASTLKDINESILLDPINLGKDLDNAVNRDYGVYSSWDTINNIKTDTAVDKDNIDMTVDIYLLESTLTEKEINKVKREARKEIRKAKRNGATNKELYSILLNIIANAINNSGRKLDIRNYKI